MFSENGQEAKSNMVNEEITSSKNELIAIDTLNNCECNIGLKARFWNPKMEPFISSKAHGRYIFDNEKSSIFIKVAYQYIMDLVSADADIMLVGVKNKANSPIIAEAASRVKVFYLTQRWLGGLLTNFKTISLNIKKLNDLDELLSDPNLQDGYTKKELVQKTKQRNKLEKFYGGIKNLQKLPDLIILFNPCEDITCLKEAKKMKIPVIALANTNADPDLIDFIVPGNNTSTKSVYLIANLLCDAIAQAQGNQTLIAFKDPSEIVIPEEYSSKPKMNERGNISFL
ncbi:30S ribosomal protein S2 [Candidatus Mycoplasma haematohominis]|uniref:Small ribosomal subunit protein uS2 n=1 Tax=Candidatus Mycoplasma haematohominis TaxID=1494318 RepID=A0A478FQT9_9MOLU|nr:30S ribosomal protein S2 [Candidatus Mycoplasma haemohominis]GCE63948.1 30S ribosomal protein S2 [Candidatus Mycoplasma haemohominis]